MTDQVLDFYEWTQQLRGCLQDLGATAYNGTAAQRLYAEGYGPADAAGELIEEE